MDSDVVEADLNVAAGAARARGVQAAHQGEGRGHPGHVVDHGQAKARGRPVRLAGHREKAAFRLDQKVVARPAFARAFAAVGGQVRAHDPRVDRLEVVVAQAQLLGLIAAHVAEHAIGGRDQVLEHLAALRMLEIEGQRPLVAIEGLEELAVVSPRKYGPTPRAMSPPLARCSILITSAPMSARWHVPYGPAPYCSTARMRRPSRGSFITTPTARPILLTERLHALRC